jgi:siroheme synthase
MLPRGVTCEQLVRHDRDPETPVAIIQWGTMPEQNTGTLWTLVEIARRAEIANPAG